MDKIYKFIAKDQDKDDIECANGEIEVAKGICPDQRGWLSRGFGVQKAVKLPEGYTAIAIHKIQPTWQVIISRKDIESNIITLYYAPFGEEVSEGLMRQIGTVGEIHAVQISGHRVILATTDGIRVLNWQMLSASPLTGAHATGYTINTENTELLIEFGLQKIGHMMCSDVITTTAAAIVNISTTDDGSGMSRPHPATTTDHADALQLTRAMASSYAATIGDQVESKGLIHQPLMLCYGLRTRTGTYAYLSCPMLMLPTVHPPRICVSTSTGADGTAAVRIDLSLNNIFQLRYRVVSMPVSSWAHDIEAVDIFATLPINTYDASRSEEGRITGWSEVMEASDSGGRRGRQSAESRSDWSEAFDGHYSEGDDQYEDHTLGETLNSRRIWFVAPNRHFHADIASADTYYRIASMPYEDIGISDAFAPLSLLTTEPAAIAKMPRLESPSQQVHTSLPTALMVYNGRLLMAGCRQKLMPPQPLTAMTAFAGDAQHGHSDQVTIRVYIKRRGRCYVAASTCAGHNKSLEEHFPRYLYYPDRNAYMMTLTQGGVTRCVALTAHGSLDGAYWWGGADDDYAPAPLPTADTGDVVCDVEEYDGKVYVADELTPLHVISSRTVSVGEVMSLCSEVNTPGMETFGDYGTLANVRGEA